jgi:hypothetical protein
MAQVIDIKKYKNSTSISKVGDHNLRQQFSENVDQDRSKQNLYLTGSSDQNALEVVKQKLEGIKHRKDANKVCNLVFSASHEEMKKIDVEKWAKEINQFCEQKFGKENIVYSVLHRDELTPHLHISFVPLIDKKLRSNVYFDGPAKISQFRKEIYEINKKYGFAKDNPEKKAKAQSIAKHYQEVREFESLEKKIDLEFKKLEELPSISFNTKKLFEEKTPTFQNLMRFAKGLRFKFKKLAKSYKEVKQQNLETSVKNQELERKVASLELKMENLGFSSDLTLRQCISLKPHIQGTLTALAESQKSANSTLPKEEKKSVENFNQVLPGRKIKPR